MRLTDDVSPSFPKSNDLRIYPEKKMEHFKRPGTHILEWGHVPWKWGDRKLK